MSEEYTRGVLVIFAGDPPDSLELVTLACTEGWPGAAVRHTSTPAETIALVEREQPAMVVLDFGMQDYGGFGLYAQVRRVSDVPVVVLVAREDEVDRVRGLGLGIEDYVRKPVTTRALAQRLAAALRRANAPAPVPTAVETYEGGQLSVDYACCEVRVEGEAMTLTTTEYALVYQLTRNEDRTLPLRTLVAKVWGRQFANEHDYLEHARMRLERLASRLGDGPGRRTVLVTRHGVRYSSGRLAAGGLPSGADHSPSAGSG